MLIFSSKPSKDLVKVVNIIKGVTSRYLGSEFPKTMPLSRGGHFWSGSYFSASTGQVSLDVKKYEEKQQSA